MDVQSRAKPEHTVSPRPSRRAVFGLALGVAFARVGVSTDRATAKPKASRPSGLAADARRRRRPKPRIKVVTRTFRNTSPIFIFEEGPAAPYPSTITVAGLKQGRLLDLNVRLLGLSHEYPSDVDLLLVAPNGRSAVIMSDVGGGADVNGLTVILDDQAPAPIATHSIASGVYRPTNRDAGYPDEFPLWPGGSSPYVALSTFTGINPNGAWKLYLVDDSSIDSGFTAGGWALTIKARARV